jgi:hypothetical protein
MPVTVSLTEGHGPTTGDLQDLWLYLQPLVGQPFLCLRESYGEEVTLHLGSYIPQASAKMKKRRGTYVLAFRGSAWLMVTGRGWLTLSDQQSWGLMNTNAPLVEKNLATVPAVQPQAFVVRVSPYVDPVSQRIGLLLGFSDGSSIQLRPMAAEPEEDAKATEQLPEIADWELLTLFGQYVRVGPGLVWQVKRSGAEADGKDATTEAHPAPKAG